MMRQASVLVLEVACRGRNTLAIFRLLLGLRFVSYRPVWNVVDGNAASPAALTTMTTRVVIPWNRLQQESLLVAGACDIYFLRL